MHLRFTTLSLILAAGIAQALFLALAIAARRTERAPTNWLLSALFALFAAVILNGFLYLSNLYQDWPWLIGLPASLQLLIGPVFLWYVQSWIGGKTWGPRDLLHLAPFTVYVLLDLSFVFHNSFYKMALMYSWLENQRAVGEYLTRFWYHSMIPVHTWVYLVLVVAAIVRHEVTIRRLFSTLEGRSLGWLRSTLLAYGVGLVGVTLAWALPFTGMQLGWILLCAPVAYTVLVYHLAWVVIVRRPQDFWTEEQHSEHPPLTEVKYGKSSLSDDFVHRLRRQLETLMRDEQLYTDPDLTLAALAERLRTSRNHLSQVLNQGLHTTFYDYINHLRVREAGSRLSAPDRRHLSVLDIAAHCGFRSRSTFHKVFKAEFQLSPSEYRRRSQA